MTKGSSGAPVVAVDIGGTKILAALFSPRLRMLAEDNRPTLVHEGVTEVIGRLTAAIETVLQKGGLKAAGLGGIALACAGGIDTPQGIVVTPSPNMPGWENIPLVKIIREKFGVETYVINDASAAALGEHRYGVGRGVKDLILLTLGTGIGGGIIADNRLYLGAVGAAGEIGHMTVEAEGPRCNCGNRGCLEMLASGTAVAREAVSRLDRGEKSAIEAMAGGLRANITAEMVGRAARGGDKLAREVIRRAAYYLSVGLVNIVNIFNPEMIVLGGGMAEMGDLLVPPARQLIDERAFPVAARAVRLALARLGNEAGVYGAAAYANERFTESN